MDGFHDPIFRGCTRPAMLVGVPLLPFLAVTGAFLLPAVWIFYLLSPYAALVLMLLYLPVVIAMRIVTRQDDQRLHQLLLLARMRYSAWRTRRHWGAYSYSPCRYKRRS
jgi:type IV secretion system protein VirB3